MVSHDSEPIRAKSKKKTKTLEALLEIFMSCALAALTSHNVCCPLATQQLLETAAEM